MKTPKPSQQHNPIQEVVSRRRPRLGTALVVAALLMVVTVVTGGLGLMGWLLEDLSLLAVLPALAISIGCLVTAIWLVVGTVRARAEVEADERHAGSRTR